MNRENQLCRLSKSVNKCCQTVGNIDQIVRLVGEQVVGSVQRDQTRRRRRRRRGLKDTHHTNRMIKADRTIDRRMEKESWNLYFCDLPWQVVTFEIL